MNSSSYIKHFRNKLINRRVERNKEIADIDIENSLSPELESEVETYLLNFLSDPIVDLPIKSDDILFRITNKFQVKIDEEFLNNLLLKFCNVYKMIQVQDVTFKKKLSDNRFSRILKITSVDGERMNAHLKTIMKAKSTSPKENDEINQTSPKKFELSYKFLNKNPTKFLEGLLAQPSALELESRRLKTEVIELLTESTTKEKLELDRFKSSKSHVQEYCEHGTKDECFNFHFHKNMLHKKCSKIHFKRILRAHTDVSLGDCSFLNTCYNINNCKYIHYEVDMEDVNQEISLNSQSLVTRLGIPPQWVRCDLRTFDMTILGKFSIIMADPPWDIHMELPYGTMADEEMKKLDIPSLQDDGYIFLWVTGRAMELGRECLKEWNYERVDELIWVKTNQLQRIIRTGRTGHWLNHGKEHCLVGVKGKPNPDLFNKGIDCDVIVAEVRATSHKPDEIYGIIERLSPGTRKVELFGRPHNVRPNWITLGNQLDGVKLVEPNIVKKFKAKYGATNIMPSTAS